MDTTYVIAHMVDVDGILCHALLQDILSPHFEVSHLDLDYDAYNVPFDTILAQKPENKIIRLVDAAHNPNFEKIASLEELAKLGNRLELYDEHDWPLESRAWKFFQKMCVASNPSYPDYNKISSAHIIVKEFRKMYPHHCRAKTHNLYALMGDTSDFNLENNMTAFTEDLQAIITSGYDKLKLIQHFAQADKNIDVHDLYKSSLWNPSLEEAKKNGLKMMEDAKQNLLSTLFYFSIAGTNGILGYASDILYMKPAMHALKIMGKGFSACIFESGKIVFSKDPEFAKSDIQCGEIGKLFNGGGRELGGGGYLGSPIRKTDFDRYARIAIRKIQEFSQSKK